MPYIGLHDIKVNLNCGAAMNAETFCQLKDFGVATAGAAFEILNSDVKK